MNTKTKGSRKAPVPMTNAEKQTARRATQDAAALRDKVKKFDNKLGKLRPANGGEAVTLWQKNVYVLVERTELEKLMMNVTIKP